MHVLFALLACSDHQYLAIADAEVIEGTPQYSYDNVWVGTVFPGYTLTEGSLDLVQDSSATIEFSFEAAFEFTVTALVFSGLTSGDTEFGDHWLYTLDDDEIAAKKAEITIHALAEKPTKEWCTPKHAGTWTCFQRADQGVNGLGVSAAGSDSVSLWAEFPVALPALELSDQPGVCDGYTVDDCCAGGSGVQALECAWDPACLCPDGTTEDGYYDDGYRRCVCPG